MKKTNNNQKTYTYDDYKYALISTGDAILMDLSYNWDKSLFDYNMYLELINDNTLTGDQIHAIMVLANKYLETSLFLRFMTHKNFDRINIKYLMDTLNHSPVMTEQFYKNIIKYDLWNNSDELARALMQQYYSIDVEYLKNERAIKESPEIIDNLMYRYEYDSDAQRKFDVVQKIKTISTENENVLQLVLKYYEETGSPTFLHENTQQLFLF